MAKLILRFGQSVLKEHSFQTEPVTVGRSPQASIFIDNPAVSFDHAKIYFQDGEFYVEDLNSLNGTFVNGKRITQRVLRGGDLIEVGTHSLQFLPSVTPGTPAAPESAAPPPAASGPAVAKIQETSVLDTKRARELREKLASKAPAAPGEKAKVVGKLAVVKGSAAENEYVLASSTCMIGKSKSATVRLKGWFTPKICAFVTKQAESYFLTGAGEKKISVNGKPLTGRQELKDGDMLDVGKVQFKFTLVPW